MKYVLLVSHGEFAPGLHKAVNMLAGEEREDVLSTSLVNGMGADEFAENVKQVLSVVGSGDEIILFADIVGGSPLATTANVLLETGLLERTRMIGGMNLPLVLTCVLSKDDEETSELIDELIEGAREQIKEFTIAVDDEDEEEDL
ncbi:MAG: PTS fructose transporter subunit IIA [Sarcina sp.]|nr:PTS fructose transporter subunit IIA [Sarcina sp.]